MSTAQTTGRVAVIIGASSGIGEAIAVALADEGASDVVHGRREDQASRVVERVS